mmetsp:Transcript_11580/g.31440  ORF Transcript_11580/g.31440 Transcript_11580/m.31440 type:complete len:263 (-) Transcript_11580:46-834(-)
MVATQRPSHCSRVARRTCSARSDSSHSSKRTESSAPSACRAAQMPSTATSGSEQRRNDRLSTPGPSCVSTAPSTASAACSSRSSSDSVASDCGNPRSARHRRATATESRPQAPTDRRRRDGVRSAGAGSAASPAGMVRDSSAPKSRGCSASAQSRAGAGSARERTEPSATSPRNRRNARGQAGAASRCGTNRAPQPWDTPAARSPALAAEKRSAATVGSSWRIWGTTASRSSWVCSLRASRYAWSCCTMPETESLSACSSAA